MDIVKHIYDYLQEFHSVTVPRLGRFTLADMPAGIRDNVVVPPSGTIGYNGEQNEDNDDLLAKYISQEEKVSLTQAKFELSAFYEQIKNTLPYSKAFELGKLGAMIIDDRGDIAFKQAENLFTENNYGLGEVKLQEAPASQPAAGTTQSPPPSPPKEESLFNTGNMQVRENTERRRPAVEKQAPPAKSAHTKTPPPKKKKQEKADSNSPMWVIWVLLGAAVLGVGGYFGYPVIIGFIDNNFRFPIESAVTDRTEVPPPAAGTETEEDIPNPEVAQELDNATDKKNALNPVTESQSKPAAQPQPDSTPAATQPQSTAVAQTSGSTGQGKYILVVGSFSTYNSAEKYGNLLQSAGIGYEIIDAGKQRFRVSVAGFDSKTEAFNQANRYRTKPHCENVWVARR